jgi:hypothetical protein
VSDLGQDDPERQTPADSSPSFPFGGNGPLDPLKVVSAAIKAVPAVGLALGLAGVAAAAAIVGTFVGSGSAAIITMVAMLLGMVVLYMVSIITTGGEVRPLPLPAAVVLWAVTLFICSMLLFLTTSIAFGWPPNFARTLGVNGTIFQGQVAPLGSDTQEKSCRIPSNGIERYQQDFNVTRSSPEMSGGHTQPEWCTNAIAALRGEHPNGEFSVVSSSETSRSGCAPFNCPLYTYQCTIRVKTDPLYNLRNSPNCP